MGFLEGMFGRHPEQEKPPETVADTAIAVSKQLDARASKEPPASRRGRFMRSAALLGLLVAGEAKAIPDIELLYEQLAQLEHELELARQDERNKEARLESLRKTSHYRTMDEALPGDIDLLAAKKAERQAEKEVEKLEKLVNDRKEEINSGAKKWTEKRQKGHGKLVDVFGAAEPDMEQKMMEFGVLRSEKYINFVGIPTGEMIRMPTGEVVERVEWLGADERYTGVKFYTPSSNELRIVYQKTDMSYDALIIKKNDTGHGRKLLVTKIRSDRQGNPVR